MGSAVMASLRPHDSRFAKMAGDHSFMAETLRKHSGSPPVFPGIFTRPGIAAQQVILHGQIRPDGTLQIEEKVNLPPGPVNVTVEAAPVAPRKRTLQVLEEIWAEREARGMVGRSKWEIDAEIDSMRDEDEDRMREIESIQQRPSGKQE